MKPGHRLTLLAVLTFFLLHLPAFAHSMYQSSVLLDFQGNTVAAELQLPPSKLEKVLGLSLSSSNLPQAQPALATYILSRVKLHPPGQQPWPAHLTSPLAWQLIDGAPYIVAHLEFTPNSRSTGPLVLEDDVITDTLPTHAVLVSIRSDWRNSTFANDPELLGVLNGQQPSLTIDRTAGSWFKGFSSIFHLGVRHIAEGTDHLLFLLALLLPAPLLYRNHHWAGFAGVRHGSLQILRVVTAFTLGHSITLALAASGLVHVPARPIEVLIAVSILVSAIHALRPLFPGREAWIAAAFGLIHGLAFASTLADLGLQRWDRVASIFGFNLGIEAMQLLVVVCVMPSLMLLSQTALYTPFRITGALFAAAAATGWIVERLANTSLSVDLIVDSLAKHAVLLVSSLFVFSLTANVLSSTRKGLAGKTG